MLNNKEKRYNDVLKSVQNYKAKVERLTVESENNKQTLKRSEAFRQGLQTKFLRYKTTTVPLLKKLNFS